MYVGLVVPLCIKNLMKKISKKTTLSSGTSYYGVVRVFTAVGESFRVRKFSELVGNFELLSVELFVKH